MRDIVLIHGDHALSLVERVIIKKKLIENGKRCPVARTQKRKKHNGI